MEITLTPDMQRYIEEKVRTGQFPSASEVVSEAPSVLRTEEEVTPEDLAELRSLIASGIAQAERGQVREWDVNQMKAELRRRVGR